MLNIAFIKYDKINVVYKKINSKFLCHLTVITFIIVCVSVVVIPYECLPFFIHINLL